MEALLSPFPKDPQPNKNITTLNERKIFVSAIIGNTFEFYDLALYGVYAGQFANLFFPNQNPLYSMLFSWLAFAIGLFSRPLGSLFFGYIGDHHGRKKALFSSILLMSLSTFLIGVLPDFSVWGLAAPIFLILLRFAQGFSIGGESNGAAIFALEHSDSKNRGLKGAIILASSVLGALLATLSGLLLYSYTYGWRLSFIFGALVGLVGLHIRKNLSEVSELIIHPDNSSKKGVFNHLKNSIYNFPKEISLALCIGAINGSLYYTLFAYSNYHFSKVMHYTPFTSLSLMAIGMSCFVICLIFIGRFAQTIGYQKTFQWACYLILFFIIPCFYLLYTPDFLFSLSAILLLAILTAGVGAPLHAFMLTLFPPHIRYLGTSFGFNIGIAMVGGCTPTLMTWLANYSYNFLLASLYPFTISLITLLFLRTLSTNKNNFLTRVPSIP